MDDKYNIFSKYYRQLIHATKHIESEIDTVTHIISELHLSKRDSILDAACGSGDLLFYLRNSGYNNISGLDASIGMLDKAKEILPDIPYFHMRWENIRKKIHMKYDCIFILSISLIHASQEHFPLIFANIHQILNDYGVFIFDNRFWDIKQEEIIEENRLINNYSNEVVINIDNEKIIIDDLCYYLDDRQYIKYRIRHGKKEEYIEVSYSRIITGTLIELLYKAGFSKVETRRFMKWPYELIFAFK